MEVAIISLAIASMATSAYSASQQNKSIQASMDAQAQSANTQQSQLAAQAGVERKKRQQESAQIEGRLRVAAGEAGTNIDSGSYQALVRQNDYDLAYNEQILNQNYDNQIALVRSGADANFASLQSQSQNVMISGFQGALSGLSTGLSIANGISNAKGGET